MSVLSLAPAPVVEETHGMVQGLLGFVGREAERAHLGDALATARIGRGATWLLAGEAGIGKSRLLSDFAVGEATAATMVKARPGDAGVPYALVDRKSVV